VTAPTAPVRGAVTAVCATRALQPRTASTRTLSGIDKAEVGAAVLTALGVEGDRVMDVRHHGGVDKAVYAYAEEDAAWWAEQLGEAIPPGRFGENLRTRGLDLVGAVIGERWQLGSDVVVEVAEPRVPCATFRHHMGDRRGWVRRFTEAGRCGTYLRVLVGGRVAGGDPVEVVHRPTHGVTIGRWFTAPDAATASALLDAERDDPGGWRMAAALRGHAEHLLTRA
jgi:MOSC domain-containing protein YiiM